jgi:hypothetical protein
MRRKTLVLLCLLAFSCGSCTSASPPSLDNGAPGVEIPADAGQPLDISQVVMTLAPEDLSDLGQPLNVSRAAEILKGTLSSIPAAEILGQQLIDDLVAAIDELQEDLSTSTSGGSGQLAALANPARNGDDGGGFQGQKSFDQDGFSGDIAMNFSAETKGDRVVVNLQLSTNMQGTAPNTLGQVLEVSYSIQGDQDACPTAEGKSMGTFSGRGHIYTKGADTSYGRTVTGIIDMEAYNAEDGTLERADLSFEGSANFEVDGNSWSNTYTSQAKTDKPKDAFESIRSELVANLDGEIISPGGGVRAKVTDAVLGGAILESVETPLVAMLPGNGMAEENWQTNNKCVDFKITPEEVRVAPGESTTVEVEVVLNDDGGSVAADITATPLGEGDQITPEKASSSAGALANFTYTAPDNGSSGSFSLEATSKAGKAHKEVNVNFPKIEWSGTFTMAGSATIKDVGTSQDTTTFTIRFQADFNESKSEGGDQVPIPFELESDASMSWSGTATALGITKPFSGSTSNLITPNYANPGWALSLPDANCLAGEGYVDLSEKKLYLFLLGIGDKTGYGSFNLSPNTTCSYHQDPATNQVYLVFPLDDEYKIADGSCSDKVSADTGGQGGMTIQSTRSWHFETQFVEEAQAGP